MENPSYPWRIYCIEYNLFYSYFQGYKGYIIVNFRDTRDTYIHIYRETSVNGES